eukprot:gnl/MRDRNA2_/MRDRNA2_175480_c0_seq1.p1 gnl/MRDRNA2_/MRDRNA2_175480_c0~~gnl/MRDRNA2_/MRDRNA2_175480_c0_seq1.p1  ORF type:complete len:645 (+),score=88.75 gnl/MRDRNA2_/MRDRNA2_175480_c0_seq1:232-1935(+)
MGDAQSYADAGDEMYWDRNSGMKVLLVNAPQRRVTCSREVTNAWYDYITDREGELCDVIDVEQFEDVVAAIHRLMKKEFDIVGPGNVIVAGYSQGGTIALHAGLTWNGPKLGGIYAISTTLLTTTPAVDPGCKMYAFHGLADSVFPWEKWAHEGYERLLSCGIDLEVQVQEGIDHVEFEWEAAVIRKCFRKDCGEQPVLKLKPVTFTSSEIASAKGREASLQTTRVATQLARRFENTVYKTWHDATSSKSIKDLCARMKAWQANTWAQHAVGVRAGGSSHFDLLSCGLQTGHESSCRPLPATHTEEQVLPSEGTLVMSIGVQRTGCIAYLTRTFLSRPTGQQRAAYRMVCSMLESLTDRLHVGRKVGHLRLSCEELAHEHMNKARASHMGVKQGKLEAQIWALPTQDQDQCGPREPVSLEDADIIKEGAYLVSAGFVPAPTSKRAHHKKPLHHLEPVWLQDTIWVQGDSKKSTLTLTQNASKEEIDVMVHAGEDVVFPDDRAVATHALKDVCAILDHSKSKSALAKHLREVLLKPDVRDLLNRVQQEDEDAADEESEEDQNEGVAGH